MTGIITKALLGYFEIMLMGTAVVPFPNYTDRQLPEILLYSRYLAV